MVLPLLSVRLVAAAVVLELAAEKNFWRVACAVSALVNDSCCRMSRTPTRAKSRTSCVTANVPAVPVAVAAADVDVAVVVGTVEVVDDIITGADVELVELVRLVEMVELVRLVEMVKLVEEIVVELGVIVFVTVVVVVGRIGVVTPPPPIEIEMMMVGETRGEFALPLPATLTFGDRVVVVDWPAMTVIVAMARPTPSTSAALTASAAVPGEPVDESATTSVADPVRVFSPSKVMRAFCAEQLRFPALTLERISVPERGIEKLVDACVKRRGMASPTVTLFILVSPCMLAVVQPAESETEQSNPVNPLMHMQEQKPLVTTLVPPFWQVTWLWHCEMASSAALFTFLLRKTKNSKGRITAAAMRIMMMTTSMMKPQRGKPQHLRPFFLSGSSDILMSFSMFLRGGLLFPR